MKSHVVKLYDYHALELPGELLSWRLTDAEIREQLELLSRNHAQLVEKERAEEFDVVRCRASADGPWDHPVTLVYIGRGLSPTLEDACRGMAVGESRVVSMEAATLTLTAESIYGQQPMDIGDALIQKEAIPGVDTVEKYVAWFREKEEARRRYEQGFRCAYHIYQNLLQHSEFYIDDEELEEMIRKKTDAIWKSMEGLPEEVRQSREELENGMRERKDSFFLPLLLDPYLVELLRQKSMADVLADARRDMVERQGFTPEQVEQMVQYNPEEARERFMNIAALELLRVTYADGKLDA